MNSTGTLNERLTPNPAMQRTGSQPASARCYPAADRELYGLPRFYKAK